MSMEIEEVVRNVIKIDKGASEIRENLQKQIKQKEVDLNKDIANLKKDILDNQKKKLKELEQNVLAETNEKSEKIIEQTKLVCNEMHDKFITNKESFCKEMFNQIFTNNGLGN